MNFYNPYFSSIPFKSSLGLTKKLNFNSIITGATKVLNLINQSIPVIKQTYPVIKNAKTMFNVLNEFKKTDSNEPLITNNETVNENQNIVEANNNYPTFFI